MTLKHFISFTLGLVFTIMIYGIITFFILMATFSLSSKTLTEKENRETFFFVTAFIVTIVTIISAFKRFKNGWKV